MTDTERIDRLESAVLNLASLAANGHNLRQEVAKVANPSLKRAMAELADFVEAVAEQ